MKTITINNTEYEIRYTIRALFIFEQIKGEAFQIRTTLDNYLFLYSMILASNKDKPLSFILRNSRAIFSETYFGLAFYRTWNCAESVFYGNYRGKRNAAF